MNFADLGLSDEVLKAVSDAGYSDPTPIQKGAIPNVLMGRDILMVIQEINYLYRQELLR